MPQVFDTYWNTLGYFLSAGKGWIVDSFPFSITEILTWLALFFSLLLLVRFSGIPENKYTLRGRMRMFARNVPLSLPLILGPGLILLLISGQSALGWSPAPTFLRMSLAEKWSPPPLPEQQFTASFSWFQKKLIDDFSWEKYQEMTEPEMLYACNEVLDTVLSRLNLGKGRTLRRLKPMFGITRVLGLSYGGPAFHDPLTGEAAMVRANDLPAPKHWRLKAICHETAHAKGFTREMDTEIITQLALLMHPDTLFRSLGYLMFLQKSGRAYTLPDSLTQERIRASGMRKIALRSQPVVRMLTKINRKLGIQNSEGKYGYRKKDDPWDPAHPFYATVVSVLEERFPGGAGL